MSEKVRINNQIRAAELRVVGPDGKPLGILTLAKALELAKASSLDLIEVSPSATPPVAKIMDYGKFTYVEQKKQSAVKAKSHITETKALQIKIGTSDRDLELKAKKISEWLKDGHRVKLDLFLPGRTKYMPREFLEARFERILRFVSAEYKLAEPVTKGLKGLTLVLERISGKSKSKTDEHAPVSPAPISAVGEVKKSPTPPPTINTETPLKK